MNLLLPLLDATSVIDEPAGYIAEHVVPHLSLPSFDVTVPAPALVIVTEGTTTLAAVICALINWPSSPVIGAAQSGSVAAPCRQVTL